MSLVERQLDVRCHGCAVLWFNQGCVDVVSDVDASLYSGSYLDLCFNTRACLQLVQVA